jgi:hypothetical protein
MRHKCWWSTPMPAEKLDEPYDMIVTREFGKSASILVWLQDLPGDLPCLSLQTTLPIGKGDSIMDRPTESHPMIAQTGVGARYFAVSISQKKLGSIVGLQ